MQRGHFDSAPSSGTIACDAGGSANAVTETASAGSSGLSYSPDNDTYTYVWKTDRPWANSWRRLVLRFNDEAGTVATAEFRFVG